MKEKISVALKNGLIAGLFSGVVSAVLNYYVLPFPQSILDNVIGHGIGGFFCGLISAFIAVMIVIHHHQPRHPLTDVQGDAGYELGK